MGDLIEAGNSAFKAAAQRDGWSFLAKGLDQTKEVVSVRPVFRTALKAWQDGKLGDALGEDAMGKLGRALKSVAGMGSGEIGSALSKDSQGGR